MASLSKIIDVHSHPILSFGADAPMTEGHQKPDWSPEQSVAYMEKYGISACVLSAAASANNATGQEARDLARRTNELFAEVFSKYPNRLGAGATIPGRDPAGARARISSAPATLKLGGIATTTSHNDTYLGEPQFNPWF